MKIGVACEGVTDFHAISHYVGAALKQAGISANFVPLQPDPDNTSGGGWANVFTWLDNNPPKAREKYFGRGLFAHSKTFSNMDSIIIHLDTDILPEISFVNFLKARQFSLGNLETLAQRTAEMERLIIHFCLLDQCDEVQAKKHIAAPIAESSEAWCVAVDPEFQGNAELLSGQALINAFGTSLARFAKQTPRPSYNAINKKEKSRERYCSGTIGGVSRLSSCTQFVSLVQKLTTIAPPTI